MIEIMIFVKSDENVNADEQQKDSIFGVTFADNLYQFKGKQKQFPCLRVV